MFQIHADPNSDPMIHWGLPAKLLTPYELSSIAPYADTGLHVPVFDFGKCRDWNTLWMRQPLTGPLLHLVNFVFPLFGNDQSTEPQDLLTPAQLATIHYVSSFIQARYVQHFAEFYSKLMHCALCSQYVYNTNGSYITFFYISISQVQESQ